MLTKRDATSGNTAARRDTETETRCAPRDDDAAPLDNEPPRHAAGRARRHTLRGVGTEWKTPSGTRRPFTGIRSPDWHGAGPSAMRHGDGNEESTPRRWSGRHEPYTHLTDQTKHHAIDRINGLMDGFAIAWGKVK